MVVWSSVFIKDLILSESLRAVSFSRSTGERSTGARSNGLCLNALRSKRALEYIFDRCRYYHDLGNVCLMAYAP